MRTLYIDCGMGAAGDMLTAALLELLDEQDRIDFLESLNHMGLPDVMVATEKSTKCGIMGTHMVVKVHGYEECADDGAVHSVVHGAEDSAEHSAEHEHCCGQGHEDAHEHEHSHEHNHTHEGEHVHAHHSMAEIEAIINGLSVSENVKKNSIEVYKLIAQAESEVHGVDVVDIHFHEVGAADAIADVVAVCLLMEKLQIGKVIATPVHVGSGQVRCAHGILPVPAPATALLLKDVPIYGGEIKGELCTPTGAALLKYFVQEFGQMPPMSVERIGYGMGKKDFPRANCVRVMLGETVGDGDNIVELTCNLDDMSPERVGFAIERMYEAGALEVYTVPVGMKKSRPGLLLCVMCRQDKRDDIVKAIFKHTTTIGIRENISRRYTLSRHIENKDTQFGQVRVKCSDGYGVHREKYEYDDLARIAKENDLSIEEVVSKIDAT